MEYDYPEHYVDSVYEAIELAEYLKKTGKYNLFRGQRHTYPIQPSALRSGVDIKSIEKKLSEFTDWVHKTPDLQSLHGNMNSIIAVAQHYGLKTPFIDFTRSPKIASFFATDNGEDGDTGTIICVNKKRFKESWEDINRRHYESEGRFLTEILNIDVNNLWRLQAQEGEFLRCHVTPNLLEMFSCFLHIYFPQKSDTSILPSKKIYPIEKSHLEVLLDQYFLIDSYPERVREMEEIFGSINTIDEEEIILEIKEYFNAKEVPEKHNSWDNDSANLWIIEPSENYFDQKMVQNIQLVIPIITDIVSLEKSIEKQLVEVVKYCELKTCPNINWSIVDSEINELYFTGEGVTSDENDEFIEFAVSEMVNSIYSGMRYLPYTSKQISRAISRYLVMLFFSPYKLIDDCTGVEIEGGKVRGRGFASKRRIITALRPDFFELINPNKLNSDGKMEFRDILFAARYVKSSYYFDNFIKLFVEDLIPSQAALAIEKLVIGVNPFRIDIFGES